MSDECRHHRRPGRCADCLSFRLEVMRTMYARCSAALEAVLTASPPADEAARDWHPELVLRVARILAGEAA